MNKFNKEIYDTFGKTENSHEVNWYSVPPYTFKKRHQAMIGLAIITQLTNRNA